MLRRDLILVQIEELGKVIAQLFEHRNSKDGRQRQMLLQTIYTSLKIDREFLLSTPTDIIHTTLDGEDKAGLQRMEIAAKTLIEEYYQNNNDKSLLYKTIELLLYVQQHDLTFSIERMDLLSEAENLLTKY